MHAIALTLCLLTVAATGQSPAPTDATASALRLHGRAVDERGKPIEGVSVAVEPNGTFTTASALANPRAKTGVDGRFELTVPEATDQFDWRAPLLAGEGWTTVVLDGGMLWGLPAERAADLGDVVLQPGTTLRGHVRTAGGRPLAGARILASDRLA